ncbi:MAG: tRNA preQ1(34) S-adenosylmethionine ribosyltransferase-isomerase QueA [Candidatus Rokubacteria bacterium]|nr:tRNA preQ1(34) S-adenosylmethionine ribosyltransferase-isomerase QueA [Candidatus Rokubacteria bacterium]MBI3824794.1 tRNA preQ1(34) S-adenosylmethionine ribosyltransferase-isomerase QueA [Candidatus Rokubacteria bacterium]
MDLALFEYDLPPAAIAQTPADVRDASRLLRVDRARGTWEDRRFADLPELLRPGDCGVLNDSRVIPARVLARDRAGRAVELLFVEPETPTRWRALVRPGRRCRPGAALVAGGEGGARLRVVAVGEDGVRSVEREDGTVAALLDEHGLPPLPPYIARHAKPQAEDRERYQTVYAEHPGSIAAPTAGLHFTEGLLARVRRRGVEVHALTLHVGPGTFRPIKTPDVRDHVLAPERVTISPAVAAGVNHARAEGRRVVAVGTTTTRALEGAAEPDGRVEPREGAVDLYVVPGHRFRVVDALVTNFHLPRSSLLVLVSAFAGRELVLAAYRHAVSAGYRFYSYGDAMLIE